MADAVVTAGGPLARTRITTILLVIISLLAVPLLAFAVSLSVNAWQVRTTAVAVQQTNMTADLMLEAAGRWALERGMTNAALNAPDPVSADMLATIRQNRAAGKAAFDQAMARIGAEHTFANKEVLVAQVMEVGVRTDELRRQAEANLARPKPQRDGAMVKAWVPAMSALIERSRDLRLVLSAVDTDLMRRMAMLTDLKDFAWVMSEFAGRERATVGARLGAGSALTAQDKVMLSQFRGRIDLAWGKILAARDQNMLPPDVVAAVRAVEANFFGTFGPIRDTVFAAADTAPMSAQEWVGHSTRAIDTVLALSREVGRHTDEIALRSQAEETVKLAAMTAMTVLVLVVIQVSFALVRRRVIGPLKVITTQVAAMARGELDHRFQVPYRDEIGEIGVALEVFRENAIERRRLEELRQAEMAARDVRQRKMEEATRRFDATVVSMLGKIKSAVERLHSSADTLSANAEQTQRQSSAVSAATEQASANVETVSAAGTELMASIQEISRQVQQSACTAKEASAEAAETTRRIGGLAEAASKIGEVVNLINDIASQTNLLALNATIESARAGEAGKGFAVVAHEVKNLAGQTGRATEDIAAQISSVQAETQAAVKAIAGISQTIGHINEMATAIAGAVEEQGAASAEIARNVEQAANGTREVSTNIAGVAQAAAETGRMAQGVFQAANGLLAESETLEHEVERFLADVRDA